MYKVLIPTKLHQISTSILSKHGFQVIQNDDQPIDEMVKEHPDAVGLIVRSESVSAKIIDSLTRLNVIIRAGAGYNTIDSKYARRKGIDVMNTPGANANAVAEEVIALILAAYRHLIPGDISARQGFWEKKKFMGRELAGKTVGVVGLGNIGRLVVKRLSGFDCTMIGYDPVLSHSKAEELGVKLYSSLKDIFSLSDIITLHMPETKETKNIINMSYLRLMKPRSVLVNCAREGILNEEDLRSVKKEKNIIFCNDVYEKDAPGMKSVSDIADIMLPHLGANTEEANQEAARRAANQFVSYMEQGVSNYVVNRSVPEGLGEEHQRLAFYLTKVARCYLGDSAQPVRIETSFYGGLEEYANWLIAPIVSGISSEFDPLFDFQEASECLRENGITLVHRTVDQRKTYGRSMTIDLFEGRGNSYTKVSVRGTITEGNPMVSRIDGFDKLYFDPKGLSLIVTYKDQPGMLAKITSVIAQHHININDIRCPFDPQSKNSIAILKVNTPVPSHVLSEVKQTSGAKKVAFLDIS